MSIERYDSLSSLDSGTYDWKVKVRISRNWKSVQKATGELRGYNMILVDDQVSLTQYIRFQTVFYLHPLQFYIRVVLCNRPHVSMHLLEKPMRRNLKILSFKGKFMSLRTSMSSPTLKKKSISVLKMTHTSSFPHTLTQRLLRKMIS